MLILTFCSADIFFSLILSTIRENTWIENYEKINFNFVEEIFDTLSLNIESVRVYSKSNSKMSIHEALMLIYVIFILLKLNMLN